MKKFMSILLAALMLLSFAACAKTDDNKDPAPTGGLDPLTVLTAVWGAHPDDAKFPIAGGDESVAAMDAPGAFSIEDAAVLDSRLGFPAASVDKIDSAASIIHMMNANTFTCGAYHVKDANDMAGLVTAVKDNILNRQWMCGFPEKLVIVTVDDCLIALFGHEEFTSTFTEKITETYANAEVAVDTAI